MVLFQFIDFATPISDEVELHSIAEGKRASTSARALNKENNIGGHTLETIHQIANSISEFANALTGSSKQSIRFREKQQHARAVGGAQEEEQESQGEHATILNVSC